jgi:NADPH2:quinone reductase
VVAAARAVSLPDSVSFEAAAASFLKGMTTEFLVRRCHALKAGETILVHAAAGGVGSLLVQWAKAIGATVIGTVGSDDKAARARDLGCDHVILYRQEDIATRVKEITGGAGVSVAYDAVGKDTFEATLAGLGRRGLFVSDSASQLFAMIASGKLRIEIGQRFKLADARQAHEALEARRTIGASVVLP